MKKRTLIWCLLSLPASVVVAQNCGVKTVELAPVGMMNAKHVCVCSGTSFNCGWAWISTPTASAPSVVPVPPDLLNALANPPASPPAPTWQQMEAQRLANEQTQLQNDALRRQLGLPTSYEMWQMRQQAKRERAEQKRLDREEKKLAKQLKKRHKDQPAN